MINIATIVPGHTANTAVEFYLRSGPVSSEHLDAVQNMWSDLPMFDHGNPSHSPTAMQMLTYTDRDNPDISIFASQSNITDMFLSFDYVLETYRSHDVAWQSYASFACVSDTDGALITPDRWDHFVVVFHFEEGYYDVLKLTDLLPDKTPSLPQWSRPGDLRSSK